MIMPKTSGRCPLVVPASGASSQAPAGEQEEASRQTVLENGRTSSLLDESHADGDGTSSAAAVQPSPIFYAGVMVRGQKSDLVRLFELPPTERLNGDFHCAMRKRVLLQGRMYVFDHYVCFYSAVFGFAKKRRMPMRTIKAVRKKKHLGFPNSLEIETDEYKEFFTSFLSREEAYQLIMKLLPEAKRQAEANGDVSMVQRGSADTGGSFTGSPGGAVREAPGPSPRAATTSRPSELRKGTGTGAVLGSVNGGGSNGTLANGGAGGGAATANGTANAQRPNGLRFTAEPSLLTRNSGSTGDDEEDEDGNGMWQAESRPAPPIPNGTRHVLHCTLPGTPREFFDVVLADSAPFLEDFLDSQGNRRINLTTWKRHPQLGHVRDMNFTAPIKGAFGNWGVSHTACFQSQRFCLYANEHIVFESSQTMTDIPYGDCFTVDQRWDIKRDAHAEPSRPQLTFDLHMRVPFSSRCLFKGVIESGSVKQVQETYSHFVEQLRPVLQDRILSGNTLTMRDPNEAQLSTAAVTPRIASMAAGLPGLGAGGAGARSLQRSVAALRSQQGFDGGDPGDPNAAFVRQPLHGDADTSVVGLLLSLARRLAEGAGGMLDSGVDVVLNLTQCRATPQMRFLCAMVVIMFLANLLCMLMYMWPGLGGWSGGGGGGATPAAGGNGGEAAAPVDAAAASPGATPDVGLPGGGLLDPYWAQRMSALQQELAFLQGRLEIVTREVAVVMTHLAQVAAPPGAAADGASAATVSATGEL